MSDTKKLVIVHRVVRTPSDYKYFVAPNFPIDPHLILVGHEPCCDQIGQLIGWAIDVRPKPIEEPRARLDLSTDLGEDSYVISFCPFCGAEIVLEEEKR